MTVAEMSNGRSRKQIDSALDKANSVRLQRAILKKEMKAGRENIYDLLTNPPEIIRTMKLIDFLLSTPKCGPVSANRIMFHGRIPPSKMVGSVTPMQRNYILSQIPKQHHS